MKIRFIILCAIFFIQCQSPSYVPKPKDFKEYVKGLPIKIKLKGERYSVLGEIIEVNSSKMMVYDFFDEEKLISIPKSQIQKADIIVALTTNDPKKIGGLAALTNLFSIAHGIGLIISLPLNVIVTATISNQAAQSTLRVQYPRDIQWEEMYKFARFPQGIPTNIDQNQIR